MKSCEEWAALAPEAQEQFRAEARGLRSAAAAKEALLAQAEQLRRTRPVAERLGGPEKGSETARRG